MDVRPIISTDGFDPYPRAVEGAFGATADHRVIIKRYGAETTPAGRYTPAKVISSDRTVVNGTMSKWDICTSHIERQNLTMRMAMRRFTRLTNAFSKKLDNLKAAVALHFAYYNFCRAHTSLRVTPAMAAGVTDRVWELSELVDLALKEQEEAQRQAA